MIPQYKSFTNSKGIEFRIYLNNSSIEIIKLIGDGTEKDQDIEFTYEEMYNILKKYIHYEKDK